MEQDKKNVIKFIITMIGYILLSALGIFNGMGTVLFPIVALPFVLYCMRSELNVLRHVIFHVSISVVICIVGQNPLGILIYIVSVVVPTYIILFLYHQKVPLPNVIMYGGLSLAGVVFVFFTIMKALGLDFEAMFGAALDGMNNELGITLESMAKMAVAPGIDPGEVQTAITQMKETLSMNMQIFKAFYAAIIVSQIVICFGIMMIIVNALLRRKIPGIPSVGQLLEFRVSKVAVVLLVICMLLSDFNGDSSGAILVFALNLMCFLANLLEVAGVLGLIALLKRTSINQGIKVLGYIGIVILFMISPYLLMFFGCLDAIFNYRKVNIVV